MSNLFQKLCLMDEEVRLALLKYSPAFYQQIGQRNELYSFLLNFVFLEMRIFEFGIDFVLQDLNPYREHNTVNKLYDSLFRNRNILATCKGHEQLMPTIYAIIAFIPEISQMANDGLLTWKEPILVLQNPIVEDRREGLLVSTLIGHSGAIRDCMSSKDMTTIISASEDKTLKGWDFKTGNEKFMLEGHTGEVTSCAISADSNIVVSISINNEIIVWQIDKKKRILNIKNTNIKRCDISANGKTLIFIDQLVHVWSIHHCEEIITFPTDHRKCLTDCALSDDGEFIITTSEEGDLKVWDSQTGQKIAEGATKSSIINIFNFIASGEGRCALSRDNSFAITTNGEDNFINIWDLREIFQTNPRKTLLLKRTAHIETASSFHTMFLFKFGEDNPTLWNHFNTDCSISNNGEIAVCSYSAYIIVINIKNKKVIARFENDLNTNIRCCFINADGKIVISGSDDGKITIWNINTNIKRNRSIYDDIQKQNHQFDDFVSAKIAGNESLIVTSALLFGNLCFYNKSFTLLHSFSLFSEINKTRITKQLLDDFDISFDGQFIVISTHEASAEEKISNVRVLNYDGKVSTIKKYDLKRVKTVSINPAGTYLVTTHLEDSNIYIRSIKNDFELFNFTVRYYYELKGHTKSIIDTAFSYDGELVSLSMDGTLKIWDVENEKEKMTISWAPDCSFPSKCATNYNCKIIAIVADKKLLLYIFQNDKTEKVIFQEDNRIVDCSFNASGRILVAITSNTVSLWDTQKQRLLSKVILPDKLISCDCSTNGNLIVVGGRLGFYELLVQDESGDLMLEKGVQIDVIKNGKKLSPKLTEKLNSNYVSESYLFYFIEFVFGFFTGIFGWGWFLSGRKKAAIRTFILSITLLIFSISLAAFTHAQSLCCTIPICWIFLSLSSASLAGTIRREGIEKQKNQYNH